MILLDHRDFDSVEAFIDVANTKIHPREASIDSGKPIFHTFFQRTHTIFHSIESHLRSLLKCLDMVDHGFERNAFGRSPFFHDGMLCGCFI